MIILALSRDMLALVVSWGLVPAAICLGIAPTAARFRAYWDD